MVLGINYSPAEPKQAEARSAIGALAHHSGRAVSDFFYAVDTPAAVLRSGVNLLQGNGWANPLDSTTRVSSEDLVENAGLTSPAAKFVGGLVAGVALDPLTYVSGPAKALTEGGKIAKSLGLLENAAPLASKILKKDVMAGTAALTGRASRTLKAIGRVDGAGAPLIDDFVEHTARPLVGQRAAQRKLTLRNLVDDSADPQLKRQLDGLIAKKNLQYEDIADERLSGSFGLPGLGVGDPLGEAAGDAVARLLDRGGEALRYSLPGRVAYGLTDKLSGGAYSPMAQATVGEINAAGQIGKQRGARDSGDLAQLIQFAEVPDAVAKRTGFTTLKGDAGIPALESIDRYVEGVAKTARDIDFVENTPKVKEYAVRQAAMLPKILAESKTAGLNAHQLKHRFGANYRPYQLTSALDNAIKAVDSKGRPNAYFDLITGDQLARQPGLQFPGGIDQMRFYAAKKEFLGGRMKTDREVADWILKDVNNPNGEYYATVQGSTAAGFPARRAAADAEIALSGMSRRKLKAAAGYHGVLAPSLLDAIAAPKYSRGNAMSASRFLSRLDPTAPVAFGNAPHEALARYATGRYGAIETGKALTDAVVSRAIQGKSIDQIGGKHVSLRDALQRVGLKSQKDAVTGLSGGAAANAREYLAAKLKAPADTIDLSQYSVSEDFLNQLTKAHNFISSPDAQSATVKFLQSAAQQMTRVFKNQILAWPSRITRDWTSATVGNLMTVENPAELLRSMGHSQTILNGDYAGVTEYLRSLPAYGVGTDEQVLKTYLSDLAESGVLKGMGSVERDVGDRTGKALLEILPGSTPLNVPLSRPSKWGRLASWDSLDPFGIKGVSTGNTQRSWSQYGKDWLADPTGYYQKNAEPVARGATTNPIFKSFEEASEWSDAHARLSGYNALLASGVSSKEAARRIKAIHVDYDSLTDFEKSVRDFGVPFYAYTARSGAMAAREILTNPGGTYSQTLRTLDRAQQSDDDNYLPRTYRERGGVSIDAQALRDMGLPDAINFGMAPEGMTSVLGGFDVPGMSAVNMIASKPSAIGTGDALAASAIATASNFIGQASPLLRTAAEIGTGTDMRSKRPVGEIPSQWDKLAQGVTGDEDARVSNFTRYAADLLMPGASRVAGFVGSALDPRLDRSAAVGNALFNTVAPVRRYFVDPKTQRRDQISAVDEMISRIPQHRSFTKTSIADDVELPPEFRALLDQKATLEKQISKENRAKAKRKQKFEGARTGTR